MGLERREGEKRRKVSGSRLPLSFIASEYAKETKAELEFKALELHADRIFDNERWVDYLKFNSKYRPEIVASTRLILIMPECCKQPGYLSQARYGENKSYNCCPHCGRWTEISLAKEVQYA